jgi:cytochrome c553
MKRHLLTAGIALAIAACGTSTAKEPVTPSVHAANEVAAGEYLTTVAGCNDCHTMGWMERGAAVPVQDRLTGMPIGWRGPWGTSYPANLRLTAANMTANQWVTMTRARNGNPPMPWMNLHAMSDQDLRAIYAYLRSLGAKGEPVPTFVPPGEEPNTPFLLLVPQGPGMAIPTSTSRAVN